MSYFSHQYVSNSNLKSLRQKIDGSGMPEVANLEEIFNLGSLIHAILLQPYLIRLIDGKYTLFDNGRQIGFTMDEYELAKAMAKTFMRDKLCHQMLMMPDFRREHEFYRLDLYGLPARAKADGDSKLLDTGLEYKGLKASSQKQFIESIYNFNYDQGIAWYLDVTKFQQFLIVGVSKLHPDRIFKELIDRNHKFYRTGSLKVQADVMMWKDFFGDHAKGVPEEASFITEF